MDKQRKVWIVFQGEYEDRHVFRVYDNEDSARREVELAKRHSTVLMDYEMATLYSSIDDK